MIHESEEIGTRLALKASRKPCISVRISNESTAFLANVSSSASSSNNTGNTSVDRAIIGTSSDRQQLNSLAYSNVKCAF